MAAESGKQREQRFRELALEHAGKADEHAAKAEQYRRMADACGKGNDGEERVATLLNTLDGAGWRVLNDRYKSRTSPANLDHIVVGPGGVTVIDAKNWNSGPVRLDGQGMAVSRYRKDEELRDGSASALVVREHVLRVAPAAPVRGVLAFTTDVGLPVPVEHHGVVLLQAEQLLPWLVNQPPVLTPQQVHQVSSALDAALPPRSGPRAPFVVDPHKLLSRTSRRATPTNKPRATTSPSRAQARSRVRSRRGTVSLRGGLARLAIAAMLLFVVLPAVLQSVADGLPTAVVRPTPAVSTPPAP